ncbi:MAG: hypothetical protein MSA90_04525 [Faecalicatena sp.]|nr:hypothetical protein [Faecalicatena sp.]MCI6122320.1 hypothetical protein [Lachnospiraceae bacterium]MCI6464715.1 hypothetical protein [Faecalicatena sp.]MDY5618293.1 hypothetical protein [Lachnospiraceae bacterium]
MNEEQVNMAFERRTEQGQDMNGDFHFCTMQGCDGFALYSEEVLDGTC